MKVIVKKGNKYLNVAWISRDKGGSIIGWDSDMYTLIKNFPENIEDLDIHYYYPKKGQFHYSYKYKINDLKYHIRAYANELSIKVLGGIYNIQASELFFPIINQFSEWFFVEGASNFDYNDPNLYKQLKIFGFRLMSDRVSQEMEKYGKHLRIKPNDIILDIDILGDVQVSLYTYLFNNSSLYNHDHFNSIEFIRKIDDADLPIIELVAYIEPIIHTIIPAK